MQKTITIKPNETKLIPILWTGEETQLEYNILLSNPNTSVKFLALLLGKESHSLSMKVNVTHQAQNTHSEIIIKSAITDSAKIDIEGLVKIQPGAKGTKAWLAAHILLLSEKARGKAIPSLEILENDIKAGHATTVGRVNEAELFYLMSRGLAREKAKQLIVQGFLQNMLDQFPEKPTKKVHLFIESFGSITKN